MSTSKNIWTKVIVAIVFIATIVIMGSIINDLRYKLKISNHNYEASKSELNVEKMKNDKLLYEKQAYILTEQQMLEELEISKKELKELNKKLSAQSVYISKLESSIKIDSLNTKNDSIVYIDNTPACVYFTYNDKWLGFNGQTNLLKNTTNIYDFNIPVPLTIGLTKDYSIFVETENPYLTITDIKAVSLQEYVNKTTKKKHWGFGIYGGVGVQYGFIHRQFDCGVQLGVGITYRF